MDTTKIGKVPTNGKARKATPSESYEYEGEDEGGSKIETTPGMYALEQAWEEATEDDLTWFLHMVLEPMVLNRLWKAWSEDERAAFTKWARKVIDEK